MIEDEWDWNKHKNKHAKYKHDIKIKNQREKAEVALKIQTGVIDKPSLEWDALTKKQTPLTARMKYKLMPHEMKESTLGFEKLTNNFLY